jgi:hypothetical protein
MKNLLEEKNPIPNNIPTERLLDWLFELISFAAVLSSSVAAMIRGLPQTGQLSAASES